MKKNYLKPDTFVVEIKQKCGILSGSGPRRSQSNAIVDDEIVSDESYWKGDGTDIR